MATLWNLVLVVSLLVLSAPQRCSGVDHGSLELRDVKLLAAMQVVSEALDCMTETIKEGFQAHEKNSAELVLMVKEQMNVQNGNIDSLKKQLTALQREDGLTQKIAELKKQLANKDKTVGGLSQEIAQLKNRLENQDKMVRHLEKSVAECQQLVSNHTNTEELLSNKVQVLEKRIVECQEEKEQPEETLVQLNNTVAAQKNDTGSVLESQPHKQEIIRLVQQFNNTKDWGSLRSGLEAVLDHRSGPYIQLQGVQNTTSTQLFDVGYYGGVQLVSLLLDAGLPVDTADATDSTMLHGAAGGGNLQLVKLLLDRGASVDVRSFIDMTPLMDAASYGHLDVVQLLVSAGADTTTTDTFDRTALDQAGSNTVIQYLQQLPH